MTQQAGGTAPPRKAPKVLLIGWDAADWKVIHPLMDAGRMPFLQSFVERGVMGNLATLHPVLSPMLWTSIATGKRPFDHGILGFTEPTPDGAAVQPVSSLSRKTKAIWNILNQEGYTSNVVGWWPSQPVEPIRGAMISNQYHRAPGPPDEPWPLPPQSVHPSALAKTLAETRVHPAELSAEEILPFVPLAHRIDQDKDRRLAGVMKTLAECVTVNNAATWLLEHQPSDFFAVYYDAIDHFCHGFMKYHPPKQEWISDEEFELYQHVVTTGYLLHDAMLGSLLRLAGPETTVILCSDHGFHPDHLRPPQIPNEPAGPAIEHRDYGVFLMAGPGIREDTLIHGTSLLDITPTILSIFDLPVGADMHGKVLVEAFGTPREVETIPSWDDVEGEDARHDPSLATDPVANREALKQLVELGYVEELGDDVERAVERTARELRYNLARSLMDADRYADARPTLEALHAEEPSEYRFGLQLAMCLRALDEPGPLRELVESISKQRKADAQSARKDLRALADRLRERAKAQSAEEAGDTATRKEPSDPEEATPLDPALLEPRERLEWKRLRGLARVRSFDLEYLLGWVCLAEEKPHEALDHLERAEKADPKRPGLPLQIGEAYLALSRPAEALAAFEKALAADPLNAHAHLGLARGHLALRQPRKAAEAALHATGLVYHYAMAHLVLGQSLMALERYDEAIAAFETTVDLNPNASHAREALIEIFEKHRVDSERAATHRAALAEIGRSPVAAGSANPETSTRGEAEAPSDRTTAESTRAVDRPLDPHRTVTIVSGMPRSGTSMMMQMLEAAGLPILTDGERSADADNPKGYYELDAVKRLRQDASFVADAVGKTLKVVAPLLPSLPPEFDYRIVFMERRLEEVLPSQQAMLQRSGGPQRKVDEEALGKAFARQLRQVKIWMAGRENVRTHFVAHRSVVSQPVETATEIVQFLTQTGAFEDAAGHGSVERMAAVVDPSLHRQRRERAGTGRSGVTR